MNDEKKPNKILEPAAYADPITGPAYRQRLAAQWAQQDLQGGIAAMVWHGDENSGYATMPDTRAPLACGNNTRCVKCGAWFSAGGGRWTVCALCRD